MTDKTIKIGETVIHNGEEYTCVGTQNGKPMCMPTKTVEKMGLPFVPLYLKDGSNKIRKAGISSEGGRHEID